MHEDTTLANIALKQDKSIVCYGLTAHLHRARHRLDDLASGPSGTWMDKIATATYRVQHGVNGSNIPSDMNVRGSIVPPTHFGERSRSLREESIDLHNHLLSGTAAHPLPHTSSSKDDLTGAWATFLQRTASRQP